MSDRESVSVPERGVALLIALIVLALLSAVAAAMVFMSSGEISIAVNQRSSNLAWDAAVGGLEEARARLGPADPSFIGGPGNPTITFPAVPGQILYILNNPGGTFGVGDITNPASPYYDWEYDQEWGAGALASAASSGTIQTLSSDAISASLSSLVPKIPYRWVRVTILTEQAADRDINQDGILNNTTPVFYDRSLNDENLAGNGGLVYRLTSLATLPDGASTMLQYDAGPGTPIPPMPAALTLCGANPNVNWGPPHSNNWDFDGDDQATPAQPALDAIATCNPSANSEVLANLPKPNNYVGATPPPPASPTSPDVVDDQSTMKACLLNATCLNNMVQSLTAVADQVFTYPNVPTTLGTDANPLITVVQDEVLPSYHPGDYSPGACDGAGILVVTGTLTCSGISTFDGIILVVGQGNFQINGGGSGAFNGEFYVAQTRDVNGNPILDASGNPALGTPSFSVNGGGANSMTYNSSFVTQMQRLIAYRVLAFRDIPHP